jgi:hypothetical protein
MNAKAALLIVAALTLSERAGAQDARPVRFWINVTDLALPVKDLLRQYKLTPDAPIPAALVGWTCKATAATITQTPAARAAPEIGVPATAGAIFQSADLVCTSKSGSVTTSASCMLSAADQFGSGELRITDVTGHQVWVGVACRN